MKKYFFLNFIFPLLMLNCITIYNYHAAKTKTRTAKVIHSDVENIIENEANIYAKAKIEKIYPDQAIDNNSIVNNCFDIQQLLKEGIITLSIKDAFDCAKINEDEGYNKLSTDSGLFFVGDKFAFKGEADSSVSNYCKCDKFPMNKEILRIFKVVQPIAFNARYIFIFSDFSAYIIPLNEYTQSGIPKGDISFETLNNYLDVKCIKDGDCLNKQTHNKTTEIFTHLSIENYYKSGQYIAIFPNEAYDKTELSKGFIFPIPKKRFPIQRNLSVVLIKEEKEEYLDSSGNIKYLLLPFSAIADVILLPIYLIVGAMLLYTLMKYG